MSYDYLRFPGFREKALTLSYDDGTVHDIRLADTLSRNGIKSTFNLNSPRLGRSGMITREDVVEHFVKKGHEVAVHGMDHFPLAAVPAVAALRDVLEDRIVLEEITGGIVRGVAYSFGSYDDSVIAMLKACDMAYARTTIATEDFQIPSDWFRMPTTCHHANPHLWELVDRFLETAPKSEYYWLHAPKLFSVWGHSYEFDLADNWEIIETFAEKVGNRDDVWYATNMEIYEYVKAYDSLVFSADHRLVYNPSAIDVCFSDLGQTDVFVPAGKTVSLGCKESFAKM